MKSLSALLVSLVFWVSGTMALSRIGPEWVRLLGGGGIMLILLLIVSQLSDIPKKGESSAETEGEVLFEDRSPQEGKSSESKSEWRH